MTDITQFLSKAGIPYRERGTNVAQNNVNLCCIFCGESRFHFGIERTKLWGRCWVCSNGGPWGKIANRLSKLYPRIPWHDLKPAGVEFFIPDEGERKRDIKKPLHELYTELLEEDKDIWNWLTAVPDIADLKWAERPRGLPREVVEKSGVRLGIGKLRGYVAFDQRGNINARRYTPDVPGPRWWKQLVDSPFLFGADWCKEIQPDVGVLTEGIPDCLRIPIGQGVGLMGSTVSEKLISAICDAFPKTETLIIALDFGVKAETIGKLRMMLRDVGYNVKAVDWPSIMDEELIQHEIKDLDELWVAKGEEFLFNFVGLSSPEVLL